MGEYKIKPKRKQTLMNLGTADITANQTAHARLIDRAPLAIALVQHPRYRAALVLDDREFSQRAYLSGVTRRD